MHLALDLLGDGDGGPAAAGDEGAEEGVGGGLLRLVGDGGVEVAELVVAELGQDLAEERDRGVRGGEIVGDEVLELAAGLEGRSEMRREAGNGREGRKEWRGGGGTIWEGQSAGWTRRGGDRRWRWRA